MLEAQQREIEALRNRSHESTRSQQAKSTESEAKDLLHKVKFSGKYLSAFKVKFQNICQLRHIWDVIQGTEVLSEFPAQNQQVEHQDKINLAKSYLQTSLSNEVFDMIQEDPSPSDMWNTLLKTTKRKSGQTPSMYLNDSVD